MFTNSQNKQKNVAEQTKHGHITVVNMTEVLEDGNLKKMVTDRIT